MEEQEVVKKPTKKSAQDVAKIEVKKFEPKNRLYKLSGVNAKSPWLKLQAEDRPKSRLLAKNDDGITSSIRYAPNYPSPFINDQLDYISKGGSITQEQIVFEKGILAVHKNEEALQRFMDVHPWNRKNGGKMFYEHDPAAIAKNEVETLRIEAEAMKFAFDADINTASAILRPINGHGVHSMKIDMITRELLRLAKTDPAKLLRTAEDPDLMVKYLVYTSLDFGICQLTDGGRLYKWADTNKSLLSIPFGNDPYVYISDWFKKDEGLEVMNKIANKLKK